MMAGRKTRPFALPFLNAGRRVLQQLGFQAL
jgi:hypothetical protein